MHLDLDFIIRFLNITLIDIALSGDNAIVIGMAAASLPKEKRLWAIGLGGLLAVALRIGLTTVASFLLLIPFLSAAGGVALLWVVYKLLRLDEESMKPSRGAKGLRQAIVLILAADFMMSVDNVLAVAGSAHGNIVLLVAGLLISMPLLMATGSFVSGLIDKARWLVYVGAAAITFTAVRMVFEDSMVASRLHATAAVVIGVSIAAAALVPGGFMLLNRSVGARVRELEGSASDAARRVQDALADRDAAGALAED